MGIIWGPRGEVTYTYSHAGALAPSPSFSSPSSPYAARSFVFLASKERDTARE